MTFASRSRKKRRQARKAIEEDNRPLSVIKRDGKTTIRQLVGRRLIRMRELRGKVVSYVELFTSKQDSHSISVRFNDQTTLYLMISPGFTVNAEHYKNQGLKDPLVLKRWPAIKSE